MRITFRQFMEDEAAPSGGGAAAPPANPDKSNHRHFDALKQQFGSDDASFDAALEAGTVEVWVTPDYSSKWGFLVNGPVSATVKKTPAGQYAITFMLKQKQQSNPHSFIMPYHQGETPTYYDGPIENKTEMISADELQDMMAKPLEGGGAQPGMGGPPMGGMGGAPPGGMGGGMPPMGGV